MNKTTGFNIYISRSDAAGHRMPEERLPVRFSGSSGQTGGRERRKLRSTVKIYESRGTRVPANDGASLIARRRNVANFPDPLPCKYCIELPRNFTASRMHYASRILIRSVIKHAAMFSQ